MHLAEWIILATIVVPSLAQETRQVYPEASKIVLGPPSVGKRLGSDALFGYSVTYQPNKRLIVSSPKADNIGQLYYCNVEAQICAQIHHNISHNLEVPDDYNYWLGATVKAGSSFFMTCAPRAALTDGSSTGTFAICYFQEEPAVTNLTEAQNLPFNEIIAGPKYSVAFEEKMTSFGWSMAVTDNNTILVGGPAMSRGRVMVYQNSPTVTPTAIKVNNAEFRKTEGQVFFNFGYGITSGYFFSSQLSYAISSPYGAIGRGKVLLFNSNFKYANLAIVDDTVGSLFGASLCTAKLDQTDCLLVGAPLWATEAENTRPTDEVGAVHIYTFQTKRNKPTAHRIRTIKGFEDKGYFGLVIVNVGDLNDDGKDEVAISAPYEVEDRGAVYIYSGSELVKDKTEFPTIKYLQKIMGQAPNNYLGLSLSPLKDYDENGCNELAIGVPGDNTVALLRCEASVTVQLHAQFPNLRKSKELLISSGSETSFNFEPCLNVTYSEKPKKIATDISVKIIVIHPHIPAADREFVYQLAKREPVYCKKINLVLAEHGDYDIPITFDMTASINKPPTTFKADHVFLSDRSVVALKGMVWVPGSNLTFRISTSMSEGYLIGSTVSEIVTVEVHNSGNIAYASCVRVRIAGMRALPGNDTCDYGADGNFVCWPPTPLLTGNTMTKKIILDTNSTTSDSKEVVIVAELHRRCADPFVTDQYNITVGLTSDAKGIIVKETSTPTLNVTESELNYGHQTIQHYYSIINNGTTIWGKMKCEIVLPPHVSISVTMDSSEDCEVKDLKATCEIKSLNRRNALDIMVSIEIPPGSTIDKFTQSSVNTHFKLLLGDETRSTSLTTYIQLQNASVPLWIIIVAAIVGLVLLFLIAGIMREYGCLRRSKKEQLEELKKDVKRQSIRRSMKLRESMIVSVANRMAEDRQKLVDSQEQNEAASSEDPHNHTDGRHDTNPGNSVVTSADVHLI